MSLQLINNVRTPWGAAGEDFPVEELDNILAYHIQKGHLSIVSEDEAEDLTPKQRVQAQAKGLGLSTSGSQEQIEQRIAEFLADSAADVAP